MGSRISVGILSLSRVAHSFTAMPISRAKVGQQNLLFALYFVALSRRCPGSWNSFTPGDFLLREHNPLGIRFVVQ